MTDLSANPVESIATAPVSPVRILILAAGARRDDADENGKLFADAVSATAERLKKTLTAHFVHTVRESRFASDGDRPDPGGFKAQVEIITDEQPMVDLKDRIATWFKDAELAVFHFIGHGEFVTRFQSLKLCHVDRSGGKAREAFITTEDVKEALDDAKPKTSYIILDCCHAAYGMADVAMIGARIERRLAGGEAAAFVQDTRGVFGLFASGIDDQAMIDKAKGSAIFTATFCDILEKGTDRLESWISLDTLFREMSERLIRRGVAAPLRLATLDERAVFVGRNNRLSRATEEPGALDELVRKFERQRDRIDQVEHEHGTRMTRLAGRLDDYGTLIGRVDSMAESVRFLRSAVLVIAFILAVLALLVGYSYGVHTWVQETVGAPGPGG